MEKLLRVENLCKNQILDHVSFSVGEGEMAAIMGPSGSGKSTLLYNIAGMDQPSGGEVWLKEDNIAGLSEDEKANLRLHKIGFVFQQMNMMSNLTILDNILLPAVQANKDSKKKKTKNQLTAAARKIMDELLKCNREGMTILMVTHDSKTASRCSRILYLADGSICGELLLPGLENGTEKGREEKVNRWLMELGW